MAAAMSPSHVPAPDMSEGMSARSQSSQAAVRPPIACI